MLNDDYASTSVTFLSTRKTTSDEKTVEMTFCKYISEDSMARKRTKYQQTAKNIQIKFV